MSDDEKMLKKDILLLLNVLSKNTEQRESVLNNKLSYNDVEMPIQAYLYVISDYYARGYYKERPIKKQNAFNGAYSKGQFEY